MSSRVSYSCRRVGAELLAFLLIFGVGASAAQAPVVPLDHFGPPVCHADAKPSTRERMSAARAVGIEAAGATDPSILPAVTPFENFDIARLRLADYADCVGTGGCYWADLDAQFKRAEQALDRELSTRKQGEKLAVVFDIDETSLSGYCEMQREDYGFVKSLNYEWVVSPQASVAIPGAVRLFNRVKAAGVSIFFITGRPESQTEATGRNLALAGFHGWKGLFLRNSKEQDMATLDYKSGRRKQITAQGYRVILNIGDQWSDLNGEPKAEVSVKLPNPFYFLP